MTYSLIIPIFNEEKTLLTLLKKLNDLDNKIEIIIIDDGSNDKTKTLLKENNKFKIIQNNSNIGKGASIKKGAEIASNENIIIMDGDLEIDIDEIPILIEKYEKNNSDVLVGIRWKVGINNLGLDINKLGNFLINFLFNLLFQSNFNDVLCCVKILKLKKFKSLKILSQGFSIEVETMAKLALNKLTIHEEKINYNRRTAEEGKKLKLSDSWNIIWTMIKLRFVEY